MVAEAVIKAPLAHRLAMQVPHLMTHIMRRP